MRELCRRHGRLRVSSKSQAFEGGRWEEERIILDLQKKNHHSNLSDQNASN